MWQKLLAVFCLALVGEGRSQYYDGGLDTLGERISASVNAQLKPLEGLGDRINAQVQQSLRPMQVRNRFVEPSIRDLRERRIELNSRLSELDGLGDRINQQVYTNLEPVRAIELNFKMRDGVGGTTIVTYRPSGRQFIVKNYRLYTCSNSINLQTGECSGTLTPFEITASSPRSDWCFYRSYSLINNQVCMSTGSVSVITYNGQTTCRSENNKPTILISLDDYKKMCSSIAESAEYRYIPNPNDPARVAIPNQNKYVKCENNENNYCIFNERNGLLDTFASSGGGGIFVQHVGNSYF